MHDPSEDKADVALRARLARLAALPVDISILDRKLRAALPPAPGSFLRRHILACVSLAAALVLACAVSFSLVQGREVRASSLEMAQMHEDMVSGKVPTMHADSIDEANQAIAAMSGDFPKLPQPPAAHTMTCCMRNIQNKRVACVLLNDLGTPVTMAIADASQVASPNSPVELRDGVAYHVETVNDLNMVMTERDGLWVCLIGAAPKARLMELAGALRF